MNHYTYILLSEDRAYIGVRSCKCDPEDDNYHKTFEPKWKKIIDTFNSREEAVENEIALHSHFEVGKNPKFANRVKQTSTGFDITGNLEIRKKISKNNKCCF